MNRLTFKDSLGRWTLKCSLLQKLKIKRSDCLQGEAIDRLAAYEDTDLTPEEFKESVDSTFQLKKELYSWVKANQEGRLVILPANTEDTVMSIENLKEIAYKTAYGDTYIMSVRNEAMKTYALLTIAENLSKNEK